MTPLLLAQAAQPDFWSQIFGFEDYGALLVLTDGGVRRFHAGEITLREAA